MDDVLAMLQYAAGVGAPLRFQLRDPAGDISLHEFAKPFIIIGRGDGCDIQLPDPSVAFRHAYLQAIGNRIAIVPLPSAAGISCNGPASEPWFGTDHRLQICGFTLQLVDPVWQIDGDLPGPMQFRPRDTQRREYGPLPEVNLELLNTSARGRKWPINRVITLLGRDESCRITVVDDRISRAHCAFLLLPTGLWLIDLLGKTGVKVDGQSVTCALLANGSEVQLGPYRFSTQYPQLTALTLAAAQQLEYGTEFLTRQNRILRVETYQETLVVSPTTDSTAVLYQDVHVESSRVMDLLTQKYKQLVIDLGQTQVIGPHVLEALASLCRSTSGKAVLCGCTAELRARHERATLMKVWSHHASRFEAIQALTQPTP